MQELWGSWEEDASILDAENGKYADMNKIKPINYFGVHLSSRGPLPILPSKQGQPVIFTAGGSEETHKMIGRFANGVYTNPYDIASGQMYTQIFKSSAVEYGRNPEDIKVLPGIIPSIAATKEEALERRRKLDKNIYLKDRVDYLSLMIGIPLSYENIDESVPKDIAQQAWANSQNPRAIYALELVRKGLTIRDVLAHGVINFHPVAVGTAEEVADFMEEWFTSGACDGFAIQLDVSFNGIRDFVEQVILILQERGLFHENYEGDTLREHMGIPYQYGR